MFYMLYCIVLYNTTSCVLYSMDRFFLKLATYVISGLGYVVSTLRYVTYIGAYLAPLADPCTYTVFFTFKDCCGFIALYRSFGVPSFIWPARSPDFYRLDGGPRNSVEPVASRSKLNLRIGLG